MGQYGFLFDSEACIGCKTCQMACKDKNDLPVGPLYRRVMEWENGEWQASADGCAHVPEGLFAYFVTVSCNHCENPACVAVCPTGAMQKDPDTGVVWNDHETCIGCGACAQACPYGAPQMREDLGVMGKCDFCQDRLEQGKDPACVAVCALRALKWGDIDELRAEYGLGDVETEPLPANTTDPCLVLLPHPKAPKSGSGIGEDPSIAYERGVNPNA